jgi:hypothetical protein
LAARAISPRSLKPKNGPCNAIFPGELGQQRTEIWHHQAMRSRTAMPTVVSDGAGSLTVTVPDCVDFPFDSALQSSVHSVQSLSETAAALQKATEQLSRVSSLQNEMMQELWSVREQFGTLASAEQVTKLRDVLVESRRSSGLRGFVEMLLRRAASICQRAPKTGYVKAPSK